MNKYAEDVFFVQAVTVQGKNKVKVKKMKAPEIQEGTDMII